MFDISSGELLLVGAVALVVIGPKDLPAALRTLGSMSAKLRRMAGEFRSQFDEAMREAEMADLSKDLGEVKRSVSGVTSLDPIGTLRDEIKGAVERDPAAASPAAPPEPELDLGLPAPEPHVLAAELSPPPPPPAAPPGQPLETGLQPITSPPAPTGPDPRP